AWADPPLVARVLDNLVANALKFTPAGGAVRIGVEAGDHVLSVTVSDTGPGIPVDLEGRLFEKFASGDRSGSGLGLAFCRHYLEQGHSVYTFARSIPTAAQEWLERYPDRFTVTTCDLSAAGEPARIAREAWGRMDGIDVLINNAAAAQDSLLAHLSDDELCTIVQLNITSTFLLTRHVLRRMALKRSGTILNVSSICARRGFPGLTVYSATKAALEGFTRSLAAEVGPLGIRVNAIAPGFFQSEMSAVLSEPIVQSIVRRTPLRTLPTPDAVVRACDVLIAGSDITGQVLTVDGGASVA
ncbi:MAG: SDR family oxidoreductase, partial [Longimicrobiales bacterium]